MVGAICRHLGRNRAVCAFNLSAELGTRNVEHQGLRLGGVRHPPVVLGTPATHLTLAWKEFGPRRVRGYEAAGQLLTKCYTNNAIVKREPLRPQVPDFTAYSLAQVLQAGKGASETWAAMPFHRFWLKNPHCFSRLVLQGCQHSATRKPANWGPEALPLL